MYIILEEEKKILRLCLREGRMAKRVNGIKTKYLSEEKLHQRLCKIVNSLW